MEELDQDLSLEGNNGESEDSKSEEKKAITSVGLK